MTDDVREFLKSIQSSFRNFDEKTLDLNLQKKTNLNLNLSTDFRSPNGKGWEDWNDFSGKYIYIKKIEEGYKYIYAPTNPFDSYLRVKGGRTPTLIKVEYNTFYPAECFDELIIVSEQNTNTEFFYQYFLSNIRTINIIDEYQEENFIVTAGTSKIITLPFPTYNLKLMIKGSVGGGGSNTFNFSIPVEFFKASYGYYKIDNKNLTPNPGFIINNYYEFNDAGGTETTPDITAPNLTFPSWKTRISLDLNAGSDLINCYLIAYSYLKIGGF